MKKILPVLVTLILFASLSVAEDKPLIMVNSNISDDGWSWINEDFGFSLFKKVLENNGYRVDQKHYEKITAESLEGIDVFCLVEPYFALLDSDKKALRKYIRGGGSVLIMGYDDFWADLKNLESFTKDYGITFGNRLIEDAKTKVVNGEGILSETTKRVWFYGWNLFVQEGKALPLLLEENFGLIGFAISTSKNLGNNHGKLAVSGTSEIFVTEEWDLLPLDTTSAPFLEKADNIAFLLDLMAYLTGEPDLGVNWINIKGRGFTPGQGVTIKTKLVNRGGIDSGNSKVTAIFSEEPEFTKLDEAETVVRTKVSTNIPAGEKKTFEIQLIIPAGYSISEGYIHVFVEGGINPEKGLKKIRTKKVSLK